MTEGTTGWYLRHRDGVEHGPFRYADIIAAARMGNIAADTSVRHETQTLDQWVVASRVQAIAEAMKKVAARQSTIRAARTPSQGTTVSRRATPSTATSASASEPLAATAEVGKAESVPIVRSHREQGYPVPKTFVNACAALFDFRFRVFITPWIVKILWAISVAGLILWTGKLAYDSFAPVEVAAAADALDDGPRGQWQFEPLGDQPFLQSSIVRFAASVGTMFLGLLCVRVVCEAAILLHRAASDLHNLKD